MKVTTEAVICFTESSDGIYISPRSFYFVRKWIAPALRLAQDCSAGQGGSMRTPGGNRPLGSGATLPHSRKCRKGCPLPDAGDGQEQMNEKEACA
ncbi:hypothetical protein ABD76_26900 [Paenibacillus dendritiformis]|nr:hypothetical protein [Paenibacillus dendritiformis]